MLPVSIKTYFLNLTYYNSHEEEQARFTELYDFAQEYEIEDLRPSNLDKLTKKFETDENLAAQYLFNLRSRAIPEKPKCDAKCRRQVSCQT
jgi:hypothetical protein